MDVTPGGRLVRAKEGRRRQRVAEGDGRHAGRETREGQRGAAAEGIVADGCHAGRETREGQRGAAEEGMVADGCHAGGDS